MSINRFFDPDKPRDVYSPEFYLNREAADHLYQRPSALRLHLLAGYAAYLMRFERLLTAADFGCGTGGLLLLLSDQLANCLMVEGYNTIAATPLEWPVLWGYDLQPLNVDMAMSRGIDAKVLDFTTALDEDITWPELLIMTETLEHLLDPAGFLERIPGGTQVLFSVPLLDDGKKHDSTHLWGWTDDSFPRMCEQAGITVARWHELEGKYQMLWGTKR